MTRRTKIVATVGPACWEEPVMRRLIQEGVNVFRLNFSHAKKDQTAIIIERIRTLATEEGRNVAILQDLQGPRIRTGEIADPSGSVELVAGQELTLTTRPVKSTTSAEIGIDYNDLPLDVKPGDTILINDGLLELKVVSSDPEDVHCVVITGGPLSSHKGINVPGVTLRVPTITEKDRSDLAFGVDHGVDYIALSFVRRADDILNLKKLIREHAGPDVPNTALPLVISKIEKHEAITNFDEILEASDGIMVARGDLGVEMPAEQIPVLQKMIIHKCNLVGKPVITATQMLDSMIRNPRPTRAEATDVANAIIDGTDALMLSGESANGLYPMEAVRVMSRIAHTTEDNLLFTGVPRDIAEHHATSITDAISQAVCGIGRELQADAIITTTTSGFTARMVSRNRPKLPIYAITHEERTVRRLALVWGIISLLCPPYESTDEMLYMAEKVVVEHGLLKDGDKVIITAGIPIGISGQSNLLKVHIVGQR
ncbi:MAG: pyk [Chloroflexi bacterium]|jgi:pyruvate kinase|nr:pyk [Chloroflexota bacterium]